MCRTPSSTEEQCHVHQPSNSSRKCTVNMTIEDFKASENESRAFRRLQEDVCTYMFQKQITITEFNDYVFLNLKDYFKALRVRKREKSNVTYLRVLDAASDSKDTMMAVLQELHSQFSQSEERVLTC